MCDILDKGEGAWGTRLQKQHAQQDQFLLGSSETRGHSGCLASRHLLKTLVFTMLS